MCVVSMIVDHYRDRWNPQTPQIHPSDFHFQPLPEPKVTKEEVEEFRVLLEKAREYDRRNNQPDCGLEEKRQALKAIAEKLGIAIDFL